MVLKLRDVYLTGFLNEMLLLFFFLFRASALSSAVSTLSNTGMSFSRMDEKEKQQALEEEQARLQALKVLCVCIYNIPFKFIFQDVFHWIRVKNGIGLKCPMVGGLISVAKLL